MKICIHVFMHELKKVLSDRKLLGSIFLMPMIIVFVTSFLSAGEMDQKADQRMCHIYALNHSLSQRQVGDGCEIVPVDYQKLDELTSNVALQPEDVILEITDTCTTIYYNSANVVSYNYSLTCEQLLIDRALVNFASANMVDISSRISVVDVNEKVDSGNSVMAIMLPYMLVLLLFQATSEYTVDTIAGEKERGVFSKTLLAPISPVPVITGKLLSSTVCGLLSSGVYILIVLGSPYITGKDTFGLAGANLTLPMIVLLVGCALLLCYFFANLSVLCSLYAKTTKEAKSMKLPVYGVTMVLALVSMLRAGTAPHVHYFIPIYNVCIVMQDVLSSSAEMEKMLITALSLLLCSFAVAMVTVLSFKKESVRC